MLGDRTSGMLKLKVLPFPNTILSPLKPNEGRYHSMTP